MFVFPRATTISCVRGVSPHNLEQLHLVGQRLYSLNLEFFVLTGTVGDKRKNISRFLHTDVHNWLNFRAAKKPNILGGLASQAQKLVQDGRFA